MRVLPERHQLSSSSTSSSSLAANRFQPRHHPTLSAKQARNPTGADAPGKHQKLSDGTTSDDFPDPDPTLFVHRKPEHVGGAGLRGGAPFSHVSVFSLHWDDEIGTRENA